MESKMEEIWVCLKFKVVGHMLATHIQHQNSQTLYFEVGTLIFGDDGHVLTFQSAKIATTWTSNPIQSCHIHVCQF